MVDPLFSRLCHPHIFRSVSSPTRTETHRRSSELINQKWRHVKWPNDARIARGMMDDWRSKMLATAILASILFVAVGDCKKKNPVKKPSKNETTLFNFLRLVVYRLIYGFATMFGGQEAIEDFMGGIFVPPGADDGDYRDYVDEEYKDDGDYY